MHGPHRVEARCFVGNTAQREGERLHQVQVVERPLNCRALPACVRHLFEHAHHRVARVVEVPEGAHRLRVRLPIAVERMGPQAWDRDGTKAPEGHVREVVVVVVALVREHAQHGVDRARVAGEPEGPHRGVAHPFVVVRSEGNDVVPVCPRVRGDGGTVERARVELKALEGRQRLAGASETLRGARGVERAEE